MDWIANTKIGLDPNNTVIKRLWCTNQTACKTFWLCMPNFETNILNLNLTRFLASSGSALLIISATLLAVLFNCKPGPSCS